jgi:hypothetical protein
MRIMPRRFTHGQRIRKYNQDRMALANERKRSTNEDLPGRAFE